FKGPKQCVRNRDFIRASSTRPVLKCWGLIYTIMVLRFLTLSRTLLVMRLGRLLLRLRSALNRNCGRFWAFESLPLGAGLRQIDSFNLAPICELTCHPVI